ncbi:MAG: polyprenyl synthetase family protein [Actinobacteria bacterium]|nr:polyprenyl synthetase family protein [Actinomycetota bacterium]
MTESPLGELAVDPAFDSHLASSVEEVERSLRSAVVSDYPFVTETSRHLVDAGGKRFRPLLTLLASHFGPRPANDDVIKAAVVVELTHLATLYHDDVMDETGDFLFARASDILADLGPEAVRIQAQTFERLCTGQIREAVGPDDGIDPVKHHLQVLSDKTGSLIATAGRFGAMMAGAEASAIDTLSRFGEAIGVAFQLADDIVDITSDAEQSGKLPGTDLREGVPTLATLIAQSSDQSGDDELVAFLSGPIPDDADHAQALRLLREHPALEDARDEARRWAGDARRILEPLPAGDAKVALEALCDYVVNRTG